MTFDELVAAFDGIEHEAFRLEPGRGYEGVPDPGWEAWQAGQPLPLRTVETDEWLAKVAAHTAAGRRVYRVLLIDWPISDYKRYELEAFRCHIPAGEDIYVADRDAHAGLEALAEDFWLLDERTVAVMRFDASGAPLGPSEPVFPVEWYVAARDLAMSVAVPLEQWVADHRERLSA